MLSFNFRNVDPPAPAAEGQRGFLDLHVTSDTGQDLSGVHVQIVRESNNDLMYDLTTDATGRIKRVSLPTPAQTAPFGEDTEAMYSNYTVALNLPLHYGATYPNVSIYINCITALTLIMYAAKQAR